MPPSPLPADDAPNTNESDPLLAASVTSQNDPEVAPVLVNAHTHCKVTPLPLLQLFILAMVRLAEPINFSQVSFKVISLCVELTGT